MPDWTRATAMLTMTSPLGADVLIPTALSAHEAISAPFQFNVDVVSQNGVIDPDELLNKPACVVLQASGKPVRYFHGIVQSVTQGGSARGKSKPYGNVAYQLTLVPRLWFMGQTVDCRVYENKLADQILQAMFADIGLTDVKLPSGGTNRNYTVQFNESDLHFATRLMEEEGWFYFFEHTASAHTLVVADKNDAFSDIPDGVLPFGSPMDGHSAPVSEFSKAATTAFGKWSLSDYNPEQPTDKLETNQPTKLKTGGAATRDAFRWPALTFNDAEVMHRADWEIEAAEAAAILFEGTTQFGGMVPGGKFRLAGSSVEAGLKFDGGYAVRSVNHQARDGSWLATDEPAQYSNHFSCFRDDVPWRQPSVTRRPRMDGIHTALVMGKGAGVGDPIKMQDQDEVYTDDLGRVKVRFFWDHRAEATGGSTVWARVIQPWAGDGWGAQFIPRVGTEVAVGFVDGDPDRPMVMGGLYNGVAAPIYLEADSTKIGFRTRSVQKGSKGSNFSEFTIDDKKGSELVYFHAEKDYTTEVENDQTLKVDNCRIVTVKKDETVTIEGKQSITVTGNRAIEVKQGNLTEKVDQGNYSLGVSLGNITIKAAAGKIELEAMQSIKLTVGGNSITIDQTGIKLDGTMVKITGQAMAQMTSPMTTVKGDGMLTLKGGITMIN